MHDQEQRESRAQWDLVVEEDDSEPIYDSRVASSVHSGHVDSGLVDAGYARRTAGLAHMLVICKPLNDCDVQWTY